MAYINGSNLRIFPASNRQAGGQQNNNWLTEFNISSLVNQFIGKSNGFVITEGDWDSTEGAYEINPDNLFEFNIAGYYFRVTKAQNIIDAFAGSSTGGASYVKFVKSKINDTTSTYEATIYISTDDQYPVLQGGDNGAENQEGNSSYTLTLFQEKTIKGTESGTDSKKYYIPTSSRLNFSGMQRFKHQGTNTQFEVNGAQITNYVIDDGEVK